MSTLFLEYGPLKPESFKSAGDMTDALFQADKGKSSKRKKERSNSIVGSKNKYRDATALEIDEVEISDLKLDLHALSPVSHSNDD